MNLRIQNAIRELVSEHGACKPESWGDIPKMSMMLVGELANGETIPEYTLLEVFDHPNPPVHADFQRPMPVLFILKTSKNSYLVDTSGYNYIRYAVRMI